VPRPLTTLSTPTQARGGLAKIKAVQTERVSHITFAPGVEGLSSSSASVPKMHMEITVSGQSLIRVYDAIFGWIYNPFAPNASVTPLSPADISASLLVDCGLCSR